MLGGIRCWRVSSCHFIRNMHAQVCMSAHMFHHVPYGACLCCLFSCQGHRARKDIPEFELGVEKCKTAIKDSICMQITPSFSLSPPSSLHSLSEVEFVSLHVFWCEYGTTTFTPSCAYDDECSPSTPLPAMQCKRILPPTLLAMEVPFPLREHLVLQPRSLHYLQGDAPLSLWACRVVCCRVRCDTCCDVCSVI